VECRFARLALARGSTLCHPSLHLHRICFVPLSAHILSHMLQPALPHPQPGHLARLEMMAPVEVLRTSDERGLHWERAYLQQRME